VTSVSDPLEFINRPPVVSELRTDGRSASQEIVSLLMESEGSLTCTKEPSAEID
jgi:hypothetical protein